MKCERCGEDYPSQYYFVTASMCRKCADQLDEKEKEALFKEAESLSRTNVSKRVVDGHDLNCPICGHDEFWKRRTLMNTPGLTFLGLEWANREADNYVCDSCGYILWFLRGA